MDYDFTIIPAVIMLFHIMNWYYMEASDVLTHPSHFSGGSVDNHCRMQNMHVFPLLPFQHHCHSKRQDCCRRAICCDGKECQRAKNSLC